MPEISVIVPVYRVEKYLHRCVDSILGQTFTDFELILVDDGSPDNCGAICDEYVQKDSRVHVIHQENGGLSAARNAGIDWAFANSDSQWLTFIDSDDWVHPQFLGLLKNAALAHNVSVSICGYVQTTGEDPEVNCEQMTVRQWKAEDFYVEHNVNAVIACGKLYRKESFQGHRYPLGRIHEDEFLTHKLLFGAEDVAVIDEPLYAYFSNDNGITRSPWTLQRLDAVDALKDQVSFMKANGYGKAYIKAVKKYTYSIADHLLLLKKSDEKGREKYAHKLRRKLKWSLIMNSRIIHFSDNKRVYECAFPMVMWVYWVVKAKIAKLREKYKS